MNRRIAKPKRRQNHQHNHPKKSQKDDDSFATSTPCASGLKRKCEDWDETPIKRSKHSDEPPAQKASPTKYSANDRLNKYRKVLDKKKHQIVKVHKAMDDNVGSKCSLNVLTTRNVSVKPSTSLFKENMSGKVYDPGDELESIHFSKGNLLEKSNTQSTSNRCDFDEDMDWSPIDEEELAADIRKLRDTIKSQPNPFYQKLKSASPVFCNKSFTAHDPLYVVVDTNIFISHLSLIKDIAQLHQKLTPKPIIYIPWMVLQELDYFKDGRAGSGSMLNVAKRAVSYINDLLTRRDKALKGQTVHEALTHDFTNSSADDSILFCCLRLQQNQSKIILLSNDQNLRSKALVHSIEAYSTGTIMNAITLSTMDGSTSDQRSVAGQDLKRTKPGKICVAAKVREIFTKASSAIVKGELEKSYGETIYKMITRPPWTLEQCLKYMKRFWVPVFSLIISQKQCLKTVDDLLGHISIHKDIQSSDGSTDEFVKLVLSLCVYFKNCLSPYEALMKTCIMEIQKTIQ